MAENPKIRILYIEDEPLLRLLFTKSLENRGYLIDTACSGLEGLTYNSEDPYDLIAIDYQLPDMTGIDVARKLLIDFPNLPLLMVTGQGNQRIATEALTLGISNYVVKDDQKVYLELIPSIIGQLLDRSRRRKKQEETEKALRESEHRLSESAKHQRLAFDNSPYGVSILPLDDVSKRLYVNKRLVEMHGAISVEQILSMSPKNTYVNISDMFHRGDNSTDGNFVNQMEMERVRLDGSRWWCRLERRRAYFEGQEVVVAWHEDITDRKRLEDEHIKTLKILNETGSIAKVGGWELNIATSQLTWTDETFRILEVEKQLDQTPVLPDGLSLFTSESRPIIEKAVQRAIEYGEPYSLELEALTAKGNVVWVYTNGKANYKDGEIVSLSGTIQDINTQKRAEINYEIQRKKTESRLALHIQNTPLGCVSFNRNFHITEWNKAAENIFGYSADEIIGLHVSGTIVPAEIKDEINEVFRLLLENDGGTQSTNENLTKDGRTILCDWYNTPIMGDDGEVTGVTSLIQDITERKHLEEQLRQSQRMDAVGQLTGGIAHDFNNLLAVMIGNAEMLKLRSGEEKRSQEYVDTIIRAVDRASSLTNRLLSFSRQQTLLPVATNVTDRIDELTDMLQRSLGETIDLKAVHTPDLWLATIDPHQFENALVNLALNSRDAMPEGGTLTIKTANVTLDEAYAKQHEEVTAGDYVRVAVCDTGTGMTADVLERVFEPFFTTKGVGEGSGLGLSMVYGFAKQSNGHLMVYSDEGQGTTIKLYMPRSQEDLAQDVTKEELKKIASGSERILVVEDNENVREISVTILCQKGYEVVTAVDGKEAIKHLKDERHIDLLFTDVVLPGGIDGIEIAEQAKQLQPNIKVLFTSGYAENSIVHNGELDPSVTFVNKPYRRAELLEKVRHILDQRAN